MSDSSSVEAAATVVVAAGSATHQQQQLLGGQPLNNAATHTDDRLSPNVRGGIDCFSGGSAISPSLTEEQSPARSENDVF